MGYVTEELEKWQRYGVEGHFPDVNPERPWVYVNAGMMYHVAVGVAIAVAVAVAVRLFVFLFYRSRYEPY